MMLLGLLLLLSTSAFTALLITENWSGTPEYTVTMFGNDIATLNSVAIFIAGIVLALIFMAALGMIGGGFAFRRRRHTRYAEVGATEWRAGGRRRAETARTAPPRQRDEAADGPPPGDAPPPPPESEPPRT